MTSSSSATWVQRSSGSSRPISRSAGLKKHGEPPRADEGSKATLHEGGVDGVRFDFFPDLVNRLLAVRHGNQGQLACAPPGQNRADHRSVNSGKNASGSN